MPRSWSYRQVEHIDLDPLKRRNIPFSAYVIIGVALFALCVFTYVSISLVMHPIQVPVDQPSMPQAGSAVAAHK